MSTPQSIEEIVNGIIDREGEEYTNDPDDSGKGTKCGITEKTARLYGYKGHMRDFTRSMARIIYRDWYWNAPGFAHINPIFPDLAVRMADFGVLAGVGTSGKFLQRCLNVLNNREKLYKDIGVDGLIGRRETIPALKAFLEERSGQDGRKVLLGMVTSLQSVYLIELAERREKDEKFEFGWQHNRAIGAIL
ncbi:hypothetical protein JWJ90_13510 [Desulfobulbus rhabdoformis]|uniref:glycoside hydrolase family 108 protein n=1 Tax=Desulfobulbus rhabdoformis TaxID=34032 RepID=UPI0019625063|nr:glycosyl hydrolase 108 family protein [Desulfobulbus rhabdoformis]MBM9615296.1 hypothetical protein [Desulfobulbus rhabdoformis]